MGQPERLLYTPQEAAEVPRLGRTTVYELMGSGTLAFIRVGRARRIPASALERFVAEEMLRQGFTS